MKEKFDALSKVAKLVITIASWLLTVLGFVGCGLVKEYASDMMWLNILLTCVGMFFSIVAVCATIYLLIYKEENK